MLYLLMVQNDYRGNCCYPCLGQEDGKPVKVDTVVISSQHTDEILDKTGKRIPETKRIEDQ